MRTQQVATLLAIGMAVLGVRPALAETLAVQITNHADVPVEDLRLAQAQATKTFAVIGVTLTWEPEQRDVPSFDPGVVPARVILLSGERQDRMVKAQTIPEEVLGLAVSRAWVVYVFCDRILSAVSTRGMDFAGVLGRVLAHELGHVVLPSLKGHARAGIMHPDMQVRSGRPEYFTDAQGQSIRNLLTTTASQLTAGGASASLATGE